MTLTLYSLWTLALALGLMLRGTRLVVVDEAGGLIRAPLYWAGERTAGERGWDFMDRLLSCPFCAGFWVAVVVVASWAAYGHTWWWQLVGLTATLSWVGGHIVARADMPDDSEDDE